MILNFHAPRYQSVAQNVVPFGFASHGLAPAAETGFQQQFYWNSKLVTNGRIVRFGQGQFGNVAVVAPAQPTTGGGAGVIIRHEPHRYSYEKYRKYRELLLAEREARKRALEFKSKKDRKALVAAVEAAKQAARALSDEEDAAERTHELTLAIQQSVHARTVAETITRSYEVRRLAAEILARIEDEEESLLLLH